MCDDYRRIKESLVEELPLKLSIEEGRISTEIWGVFGEP